MIKIVPSGDYVQLKYVDTLGEYVQEELKSDADAIEYSSDSGGKIYLKFGRMTFDYFDPTEFEIDGSAVTDAADFITKLTALFSGGGGGGGVTIYTGDGSLISNRLLDLNGFGLEVVENSRDYLILDPRDGSQRIFLSSNDGAGGETTLNGYSNSGDGYQFYIKTSDGLHTVNIEGDAVDKTLEYTADTHTFNGKIITPDLAALDFADDAAAASGGVVVNQWYHTSGTLKIRLT